MYLYGATGNQCLNVKTVSVAIADVPLVDEDDVVATENAAGAAVKLVAMSTDVPLVPALTIGVIGCVIISYLYR